MMGDEIHDEADGDSVSPVDPAEQHRKHHEICRGLMQAREDAAHTAAIRAMLMASRVFDVGLTPGAACQIGCQTCGVIDANPARCEQCTGAHRSADHFPDAGQMVGRPFTGRAPGMLQDDDRGLSRWLASTPEAMRCAARDAALNIDADSEGGECA